MCSRVRTPSDSAQQVLQRLAGLGERVARAQSLRPVLDDVRELSGRQSQALIQRHPLDLLALARALDEASQHQRAEERDVTAFVGLGQALPALPLGTVHGVADITIPFTGDEDRHSAGSYAKIRAIRRYRI